MIMFLTHSLRHGHVNRGALSHQHPRNPLFTTQYQCVDTASRELKLCNSLAIPCSMSVVELVHTIVTEHWYHRHAPTPLIAHQLNRQFVCMSVCFFYLLLCMCLLFVYNVLFKLFTVYLIKNGLFSSRVINVKCPSSVKHAGQRVTRKR